MSQDTPKMPDDSIPSWRSFDAWQERFLGQPIPEPTPQQVRHRDAVEALAAARLVFGPDNPWLAQAIRRINDDDIDGFIQAVESWPADVRARLNLSIDRTGERNS